MHTPRNPSLHTLSSLAGGLRAVAAVGRPAAGVGHRRERLFDPAARAARAPQPGAQVLRRDRVRQLVHERRHPAAPAAGASLPFSPRLASISRRPHPPRSSLAARVRAAAPRLHALLLQNCSARLWTALSEAGTHTTVRARILGRLATASRKHALRRVSASSKSSMRPCWMGEATRMWLGVRPTISLARSPTATTWVPVPSSSMATKLASSTTVPRPRAYTRTAEVPRSMA